MSTRPEPIPARPPLSGNEGELVSVRISVEPRLIERVLDVLARLEFPINPQLLHPHGGLAGAEFPAWAGRLAAIREALRSAGLASAATIAVRRMADEIAGPR